MTVCIPFAGRVATDRGDRAPQHPTRAELDEAIAREGTWALLRVPRVSVRWSASANKPIAKLTPNSVELPGIEPVSRSRSEGRKWANLPIDVHRDSPELTGFTCNCAQNVPTGMGQHLTYLHRRLRRLRHRQSRRVRSRHPRRRFRFRRRRRAAVQRVRRRYSRQTPP